MIPVYSRPARNVQIRDMFWFTVIIPFIPTFLLSHPSLIFSNGYRSCLLVFSYPIAVSPDLVPCLVVDFVEVDEFGLVTGITSLFGIVDCSNFSSHRDDDGSDQRTVSSSLSFRVFVGSDAIQGIGNTSMLPASMVEEAGLGKGLVPHCCSLDFLPIVRQLTCALTMVSYQSITQFYSFLIAVLLVYSNGRSKLVSGGRYELDGLYFSRRLTCFLTL